MSEQPIRVVCDQREVRSGVIKELDRLGCDIHICTMEVGDYCVSDRVCFERKDIDDFMTSWLVEKKIFSQVGDMAKAYERPILIIEGGDPFYAGRQVHPNAIQGCLNTIAVSFRTPILYSNNPKDTANIICMIGRREQTDERRVISLHGKRSHLSESQIKEYIVSAIPDLGTNTAKALLQKFGSVEAIFSVSKDQLMTVENIGEKKAQRIRDIVGGIYLGK